MSRWNLICFKARLTDHLCRRVVKAKQTSYAWRTQVRMAHTGRLGQNQTSISNFKYYRDCWWPRRPWPNAGRRKQKRRPKNSPFFLKKIKFTSKKYFFCIYLLVMPKYWVKNYFAHGRFPEVGQKQKTEKKKKRERERERKTEQWQKQWPATHCNATSGGASKAAWAKSS